jgi:hypothetical protein
MLESFVDYKNPPKADLHLNIEKKNLQACYFIYKLGLDVIIPKHKPIKAFNTPCFGTRKVVILLITQ